MILITKGFILLLAFTLAQTKAQPLLQGQVKTQKNTIIANASVEYLHHQTGCMANDAGHFTIAKIPDDSIRISAVGYLPVVLAINKNTNYLEANLTEDEVQLQDVKVAAGKMKTISLGYYSGLSFFHEYIGPGTENSILISNKKNVEGFLNEIKFKITNAENSPWNLRVRLRSVDTATGLPSNESPLFEGDISAKLLKKVNRVVLKDRKVLLPSTGIFVSLEWLYPDNTIQKNYAQAFITPAIPGQRVSERHAYFKYTRSSNWQSQVSPEHPNSYFAYEDKLYAPSISILVSVAAK